MKWKLNKVTQETNHPFLNFFTLTYEVTSDDGKTKTYDYYMTSRRSKDELLVNSYNFVKPDGIVIPLYYKDKDGKIFILLTKQFRPSVGRYLTSFVAGLVDSSDKNIEEVIKREAKEEAGAIVADIEILSSPAPTSVGISDEINMVALARIDHFESNKLEEFEDISVKLYDLDTIKKMLNDSNYLFPVNIRILLLYLFKRFEN